MKEIRRGYCGLCHPRCGTLLHLDRGRVVKVTGDPNHPVTKGVICERGRLMPEHIHHPDRLNHPLKRIGDKGAGKWQHLSWEEALDEVAEKLSGLREKYGAETLAFTHGTARTYEWDGRRFFNLFGSPNIAGVNSICFCPSYAVEYATYGGMSGSDISGAACIVLWGFGPSQSEPVSTYPDILRARKRGAKLIVIDPRKIKEAEKADLWLQIRPGTDLALMLGWLRIILAEDRYDHRFVDHWTVGFEDLWPAVEAYTPEKVSEITTIPADLVTQSVRMYTDHRPAVIPFGVGLDKQGVNATQNARARAIIRAITGNLEAPGGDIIGVTSSVSRVIGKDVLELNEVLPPAQRAKQLHGRHPFFGFPGWERYRAANDQLPPGFIRPPLADNACLAHAPTVFDAMLTGRPYPVTAMISLASNPLLSFANTKHVFQALQALQLYVVMDYYLTPSAALADYIFPASSTVEQVEMWLTGGFCMACPQGIDPLFDRKNSYFFYRGLGLRLGQDAFWPWETMEAVYDHCLKPAGWTFQRLVDEYGFFGEMEYGRHEKYGFGTPSGKVEIRSSIFQDLDLDPIPVYREPKWSPRGDPDLVRDYPLILMTGNRFLPMYHSEQRQIETARRKVPHPLVTLHPETAAKQGLTQGDRVAVATPLGRITVRLDISDAIAPTMADLQHGWWFPEKNCQLPELFGVFDSNANVLCPDAPEFCSPEVGGWPHTALMCRIEKVE